MYGRSQGNCRRKEIKARSSLALVESKACIDRLLDGENVVVECRRPDDAEHLSCELSALGLHAQQDADPP